MFVGSQKAGWLPNIFAKETNKFRGFSLRANYTDGRLSVKLVTTSADRGYHVVNAIDSQGRILGFLDGNTFPSWVYLPVVSTGALFADHFI
jgi:hypothetical protein